MGSLPGLAGLGGGAGGTGFAGPQSANIIAPTNSQQVQQAYTGVQGGLTSQQQLLQALQAQQGVQNQSQVYGQLQGIASGAVNPAQAQFNQNTAANVANQAALMAGQRGAGSNVGLIARQAAQQGAATQQQAVGQEAAQQAQNQVAAIQGAGQLATTQAGQQIGQTNANVQAQQSEQGQLLNALQGYNTNQVAMQSNINNANAGLAGTMLQGQQSLIGGALGSAGLAGFSMAAGGEVPQKMADGGYSGGQPFGGSGGSPSFGQFLVQNTSMPPSQAENVPYPATSSGFGAGTPQKPAQKPVGQDQGTNAMDVQSSAPVTNPVGGQATSAQNMGVTSTFAKGGKVPALLSPGEVYLSPRAVEAVRNGADPMKVGEKIGGKPKVGGAKNSYANDTVKKNLQEGGVVVPRSETKSKNPEKNSADFVDNILAKRRARK